MDLKKRLVNQLSEYPQHVLNVMYEIARADGTPLYLSGGALRDWLIGHTPNDLDFTISHGSVDFLTKVQNRCGDGTIVPLGLRHDDTIILFPYFASNI